MATRSVSARITDVTGNAREGALVEFVNSGTASAITDAGGVFVVDLETTIPHTVGFSGALQIDGIPYPAGTVFTVTVPDGESTATFAESLVNTIDASPAALLLRIVALEEALSLPSQQPVPAPPAEGEGV